MSEAQVILLGVRGSLPTGSPETLRYGGDTLCVLVRLGGQTVLLDAGTGLLSLSRFLRPEETALTLLLTHPHLDHLLGLPLNAFLMNPAHRLDIRAASRGGLGTEEQLNLVFSPPLWPVRVGALPASVRFLDLPEELPLGGLRIRALEGNHPGGVSLLRLEAEGKSVVLMTDCTISEDRLPALLDFAADCSLLLIDGQYSEAEWKTRAGFGHNTWSAAAAFGQACGARQVRIIHHDLFRTDAELDAAAPSLLNLHPGCRFGRSGEEMNL